MSERKEQPFEKNRILRNLSIASELYAVAYEIKKTRLTNQHPNLSEKELHELTIELIDRGCR